MDADQKKGILVVISAPSGGGKTTVIRRLIERMENTGRIISTTTREPRLKEEEGVDYYYITKEDFEEKIREDGFIEHAEYAGNYYGIEKKELARCQKRYDYVFAPIDRQGKISLDKAGIQHVSVFLKPKQFKVLKWRIMSRPGVSKEDLKKRLITAKKEIEGAHIYDNIVVNEDGRLNQTIEEVINILDKKRGI